MPVAQCAVCGEIVSSATSVAKEAPSRSASGSTVICSDCLAKLASDSPTNRTTVMRPAGTLRVDDKSIVPPALETSEIPPALVLNAAKPIFAGPAAEKEADNAPVLRRQFGSYEIISEVSRGSFGVVYRAKQQGLDRIVALKVLLAGVHASPEAVARFQREAKSVARLKHPNVVPIYDIGTHDGHHYFAMEFIEGHALSTLIADKKVSTSEVLSIAEALADALESAHKAGVIHRDIKPSNIIVDREGRPHITDFGLAKQIDLDTKYTVSGTTLGTPAYMPPEQARGEIEKIDARSDVYSIGAVLYEMLTGRTPFVGRSLLEVVVAVINEPLKPPRQLNAKIHRDVQTIVMKCLEKDPRLRYDSAADLRDDLRRFRSGEAIRAKPAGVIRLAYRFFRRQSPLLGAVGVVLFAVFMANNRVQKSRQDQARIEEQNRQLEKERLISKLSKEIVWRPSWWFPLKATEELATEELQKRYKIPPGKEEYFKGLVKGKIAGVLDYNERDPLRPVSVPGDQTLTSPEEHRFAGDLEADIVFQLTEPGIDKLVRVGIQSNGKGHDGVPYLVEFRSGLIRLIGPEDLYVYANTPKGQRPPQLKMVVKAEKRAPELLSGRYTLTVRRDGTYLSFRFRGPVDVGIEIVDSNLTSFVFSETQLTFRPPLPPGIKIESAEVRRKYGGEDEPGAKEFLKGDYYSAEDILKVVAETEIQPGDDGARLKKARALFQLGLIQEICQPAVVTEPPQYAVALSELRQITGRKRQQERNKLEAELKKIERERPKADEERHSLEKDLQQFDKEQQRFEDDCRRLTQDLHVRRMSRAARARSWPAVAAELKDGWPERDKIGEPLVWEAQNILELAAAESERKLDGVTAPEDFEAASRVRGEGLQAGFALFLKLGVETGSTRIGRAGEKLLNGLIRDGRWADIAALHKAYPSDLLWNPVIDAIRVSQIDKIDDALKLLTYITPRTPKDKDQRKFHEAAAGVVQSLMRSSRFADAAAVFGSLPNLTLLRTVCEGIKEQANALATEEERFKKLTATLLPPLVSRLRDGTIDMPAAGNTLLADALGAVAQAIIKSGNMEDLTRLHAALRGAQAKTDARLAGSFAAAMLKLIEARDTASEALAMDLLKYAGEHVTVGDAALQDAAYLLGKLKARVDDERTYAAINRIQETYPTPKLLKLAHGVMVRLLELKRYEEAVLFYTEARVKFRSEGAKLTPLVLSAMDNISGEQRSQLMKQVQSVGGQLAELKDDVAERAWRLEYGDILLAQGQWEAARELYHALYAGANAEPALMAHAGLRLAALYYLHPDTLPPNEVMAHIIELEKTPPEARLAARVLAADTVSLDDIAAQVKAIPPANRLLSDSEWDLLRGIRMRRDQNRSGADIALQEALRKSSETRSWVQVVASQLMRSGGERSPDEKVKPPEKPSEVPK